MTVHLHQFYPSQAQLDTILSIREMLALSTDLQEVSCLNLWQIMVEGNYSYVIQRPRS